MENSNLLEYKGFKIEVTQDDLSESPRDWENLGTMTCFHNGYDLGDKNDLSIDDLEEIAKDKNYISLPLFLYDHSGITMNTTGFSCKWDSGQVGLMYVSLEKVRKEYSVKKVSKKLRAKIIEYLISEVDIYDKFLAGDVYGYIVDDFGSCSGFYGHNHERSGLLEQAKNCINCHIQYKTKDHAKQVKIWIKNRVPLQYRDALSVSA